MAQPGADCDRHERELEDLRRKAEEQAEELAEKETAIVALQRDLVAVSQRVPANLGEWMGETKNQLANVASNVNEVIVALRTGYVTVSEFKNLEAAVAGLKDSKASKEELAPIKSAFWKGIGIIVTTFLLGLLALLKELGK